MDSAKEAARAVEALEEQMHREEEETQEKTGSSVRRITHDISDSPDDLESEDRDGSREGSQESGDPSGDDMTAMPRTAATEEQASTGREGTGPPLIRTSITIQPYRSTAGGIRRGEQVTSQAEDSSGGEPAEDPRPEELVTPDQESPEAETPESAGSESPEGEPGQFEPSSDAEEVDEEEEARVMAGTTGRPPKKKRKELAAKGSRHSAVTPEQATEERRRQEQGEVQPQSERGPGKAKYKTRHMPSPQHRVGGGACVRKLGQRRPFTTGMKRKATCLSAESGLNLGETSRSTGSSSSGEEEDEHRQQKRPPRMQFSLPPSQGVWREDDPALQRWIEEIKRHEDFVLEATRRLQEQLRSSAAEPEARAERGEEGERPRPSRHSKRQLYTPPAERPVLLPRPHKEGKRRPPCKLVAGLRKEIGRGPGYLKRGPEPLPQQHDLVTFRPVEYHPRSTEEGEGIQARLGRLQQHTGDSEHETETEARKKKRRKRPRKRQGRRKTPETPEIPEQQSPHAEQASEQRRQPAEEAVLATAEDSGLVSGTGNLQDVGYEEEELQQMQIVEVDEQQLWQLLQKQFEQQLEDSGTGDGMGPAGSSQQLLMLSPSQEPAQEPAQEQAEAEGEGTPLPEQWKSILDKLNGDQFRSADLVNLWFHLVQALRVRDLQKEEYARVHNYSQQQTLDYLHRHHREMVNALKSNNLQDTPALRDHRAKVLELAQKAALFKTFRRHRRPLEWPLWLREEGMEALLQDLHRTWTLRRERWNPAWSVPVETEEGHRLTVTQWQQWLAEALEAVRQRHGKRREMATPEEAVAATMTAATRVGRSQSIPPRADRGPTSPGRSRGSRESSESVERRSCNSLTRRRSPVVRLSRLEGRKETSAEESVVATAATGPRQEDPQASEQQASPTPSVPRAQTTAVQQHQGTSDRGGRETAKDRTNPSSDQNRDQIRRWEEARERARTDVERARRAAQERETPEICILSDSGSGSQEMDLGTTVSAEVGGVQAAAPERGMVVDTLQLGYMHEPQDLDASTPEDGGRQPPSVVTTTILTFQPAIATSAVYTSAVTLPRLQKTPPTGRRATAEPVREERQSAQHQQQQASVSMQVPPNQQSPDMPPPPKEQRQKARREKERPQQQESGRHRSRSPRKREEQQQQRQGEREEQMEVQPAGGQGELQERQQQQRPASPPPQPQGRSPEAPARPPKQQQQQQTPKQQQQPPKQQQSSKQHQQASKQQASKQQQQQSAKQQNPTQQGQQKQVQQPTSPSEQEGSSRPLPMSPSDAELAEMPMPGTQRTAAEVATQRAEGEPAGPVGPARSTGPQKVAEKPQGAAQAAKVLQKHREQSKKVEQQRTTPTPTPTVRIPSAGAAALAAASALQKRTYAAAASASGAAGAGARGTRSREVPGSAGATGSQSAGSEAATEVPGGRAEAAVSTQVVRSTWGGGAGRPLSVHERQRLQAELDIIENDAFLQAFYNEGGRNADRWQRFVIRLRYRGRDPDEFTREWVTSLLEEGLGLRPADVPAIASPLGLREIDLEFDTEQQYAHFWDVCRLRVREQPQLMDQVVLIPLFRGETKVLNISFRTTKVPTQDIDFWLRRHCKVLQETSQKYDERGYRSSDYRAIVQLDRNMETGGYRHIPKFFFLGADRGVTRYSGQPAACYTCGDWWHKRDQCVTRLCSRCGTRGHRTAACNKPMACSLCGREGHEYRLCPEAFLNREHPEEYQRDLQKAQERRDERERDILRKRDPRSHVEVQGPALQPEQEPEQEWRTQGGGKRQAKKKQQQQQQPMGEKSRGGAPPPPSTGSDPQWIFGETPTRTETSAATSTSATYSRRSEPEPRATEMSDVSEGEDDRGQRRASAEEAGEGRREEADRETRRREEGPGDRSAERLNSRARRRLQRAAERAAREQKEQEQEQEEEMETSPAEQSGQAEAVAAAAKPPSRRTPAPCPRKGAGPEPVGEATPAGGGKSVGVAAERVVSQQRQQAETDQQQQETQAPTKITTAKKKNKTNTEQQKQQSGPTEKERRRWEEANKMMDFYRHQREVHEEESRRLRQHLRNFRPDATREDLNKILDGLEEHEEAVREMDMRIRELQEGRQRPPGSLAEKSKDQHKPPEEETQTTAKVVASTTVEAPQSSLSSSPAPDPPAPPDPFDFPLRPLPAQPTASPVPDPGPTQPPLLPWETAPPVPKNTSTPRKAMPGEPGGTSSREPQVVDRNRPAGSQASEHQVSDAEEEPRSSESVSGSFSEESG